MAKENRSDIDDKRIAQFDKLIEGIADIERKGATIPYTSVNGHMFSYFNKDDGAFALRLPEDVREEFLKKYKTKLCVSYGVVMKEYAIVPDVLLAKTKELKPYFLKSYEYIKRLKPKPTKKGK